LREQKVADAIVLRSADGMRLLRQIRDISEGAFGRKLCCRSGGRDGRGRKIKKNGADAQDEEEGEKQKCSEGFLQGATPARGADTLGREARHRQGISHIPGEAPATVGIIPAEECSASASSRTTSNRGT